MVVWVREGDRVQEPQTPRNPVQNKRKQGKGLCFSGLRPSLPDSDKNVVFEADSDSVLSKGLAAYLFKGFRVGLWRRFYGFHLILWCFLCCNKA
ncbi:hypothetical protein RHSIM_Rhsim01G0036500 [Rhododendron simsii]|uniref:Uncharacterized protein n=1 Tax=Rhododendron simsii TaxID=118357 RepID=A0A834M018_RHOSS|nr:hypothetical protein RHSIM_Rhsim01G0036500 [Rhododendron simsii]